MTQTARSGARHEHRSDRPTNDGAIITDQPETAHERELDFWWRSPHWEAYAAGWDAGRRQAGRDVGNAVADAAAPLPHTAGEVVRRLVGTVSREMAQSAARTSAGGANGTAPGEPHGWPGARALSRAERVAAYQRLLDSWGTP